MVFPALANRTETRALVHHATGGEGDEKQVYKTLRTRKSNKTGKLLNLSIHLFTRADGLVFQFADLDARCIHAGSANSWSVGHELQNRMNTLPISHGIRREVMIENIHGKDRKITACTVSQIRSALAITASVCEAYALPWAVPMDGHDVLSTVLPDAEIAKWRGALGHLHLSAMKVDPTLSLLRAIAAFEPRQEQGMGGPAE
jgi:N-acetyl-anhydromuramyl-L-alanine amidase AmpD